MPQIGCDDVMTGTLGAAQDTVVIASPSASTVSAQVTGTFSGTITWEGNTDRVGGNWTAIPAGRTDGTGTVATTAVLAGAPNNVSYVLNMGGLKRIRARCSSYTSGTASVHFNASVGSFATGLAGIGAGGGAATIADGADVAQGTTTDAGIITDANGTVIGFLRGAIKMWITFLARFPAALGGTTAAASLPVTLASDGTYATLQGGVTETAPATDTASSGANGRLQRIAQRLSSLIALLPTALISNRLDVNLGAAPATVTVQGGAAAGAAVAGNPLRLGASDGASIQDLLSTTGTVGLLRVAPGINGALSDNASNTVVFMADQAAASRLLGSVTTDFNGTGWDKRRNNVDVTDLASAARTTTQTSADIVVYNGHSLIVTLDTTVASTGSVTLTINYKDPASGKYILLLSGAAVNTVTTNKYEVNQISLAAVANVSARADLGRIIQLVVTANNANTQTYSLGHTLVS